MIYKHDITNIESYLQFFQISKKSFIKELKKKKECIECKYYFHNNDKFEI